MKTTLKLMFACIFFFTYTICNAQDAVVHLEETTVEIEQKTVNSNLEKPFLSPKQVYLNHTQSATNQFLDFLTLNVTYPEHLKSYGIEGEVIVEVVLLQDGTIKETKVFKSLQNDLDRLVLSAVDKMKNIYLTDNLYKGAKRLRIPVEFSLR